MVAVAVGAVAVGVVLEVLGLMISATKNSTRLAQKTRLQQMHCVLTVKRRPTKKRGHASRMMCRQRLLVGRPSLSGSKILRLPAARYFISSVLASTPRMWNFIKVKHPSRRPSIKALAFARNALLIWKMHGHYRAEVECLSP